MSVIENGRALYYPYIHLQDSLWLKTAALYYDKLARIVPLDLKPNDTKEAKILQKELDFFEEIDPSNEAERLAPEFLAFAQECLASQLNRNFGIIASMKRLLSSRRTIPSELVKLFEGKPLFRINRGKMARESPLRLERLGLAHKIDDDYFNLEPLTGALYMAFLAKEIAEERRLPIVTDDPLYQPLIHHPISFSLRAGIAERTIDKGFLLASFVIESVAPKDIRSVSINQIISFRQKHDAERINFRNKITELARDIDKLDHPDAIQDYLFDRRRTIEQGVKGLEDGLRSVNIECIRNLFAISVPAWVGVSSTPPLALLSPIVIPGVVMMAAALTLIKAGIDRNKEKRLNQYSYVLSLKKDVVRNFLSDLQGGNTLL